jgi:hypothetical protein
MKDANKRRGGERRIDLIRMQPNFVGSDHVLQGQSAMNMSFTGCILVD